MLHLVWIAALLLPRLTESYTITLQPTDNLTIHIERGTITPSQPCYICAPKCNVPRLHISRGEKVDYTFSCSTPEKYFIMEINRTIDCSSGMCPLNISLQPTNLHGLNRTFFWNILTSKNNGLIFGFSGPWLTQIDPSSRCPDHVSIKISTSVHDSSYSIGTFCRNGTITHIKVQEKGVIALSLPWNVIIKDPGISITNRSSIKSLSIVESTFRQQSTVTLLSANYPDPFPNNEQMTWKFNLPENHAAAVKFLNHTSPMCVKKEENVYYYLPKPALHKLTDNQPANIFQNFNLTLQNCEVDTQKTGPPGLSLKFNITIQRSQGDIHYALDLTKEKGLVVHIKKSFVGRTFTPVCLICKAPMVCDTQLVLEGGRYYKISFLCERLNSLMITAEKVIECWDLKTCSSRMPLTIPQTLIDFPVQLESYSWKLIAPENISNEIVSKSVYLQQDVVDKPCNAAAVGFTYDIFSSTNKDTFKIGTFCPNGSIEKIQLRDNVTITLKTPKNGNPQKLLTHDLHVSFESFIKEVSIFAVSPKTEAAIYLETPNYEYGLPDYASTSWSINLTKKQSARLKFGKDKMDISCEQSNAFVNIKEQKDGSPETVRREDQKLPSQLDIYSTFWVNISNCKPWKGTKKLKLQFCITFNQISPVLKYILIAAALAVGVVLAVITTICCIKNKKKQIKAPVGIYNSKVNTEAPRRQAFFKKGRKNNESHIYDVIDDHMVYGHLLKEETNEMVPEVDVYQPFEGPMGNAPPIPLINFPNGSTRVDVKDESIKEDIEDGSINGAIMDEPRSLSMKDNDIYIFSQSFSKQPVENEDTSITYMDATRSGATTPV